MIDIKKFLEMANNLDLSELDVSNVVIKINVNNEWIVTRLEDIELSPSNKNMILVGKPINPDSSSLKPKMEVVQ